MNSDMTESHDTLNNCFVQYIVSHVMLLLMIALLLQDVARAATIAMDYRITFENDMIVNMTCFRRWSVYKLLWSYSSSVN